MTLKHTLDLLFQIKMLRDRKQGLERRLSAMMEENHLLQGTVEELQDRVLILERQSHEKDTQVRNGNRGGQKCRRRRPRWALSQEFLEIWEVHLGGPPAVGPKDQGKEEVLGYLQSRGSFFLLLSKAKVK